MRRRSFLAALAALPAGALALPETGTSNAFDRRLLLLGTAAVEVKTQGMIDAGQLAEAGLLTAEAQASLTLPGFAGASSATLLRLFFATAQFFIGNAMSATPVIGYYSPTNDLWWLSRWAVGDGDPIVTAGRFVAGGGIRGGTPATQPRWIRTLSGNTFIEAMRTAVRDASGEFSAQFGLASAAPPTAFDRIAAGPDGHEAAAIRLGAMAQQIARMSADHGWPACRAALLALSDPVPAAPTGLSASARETFARLARLAPLFRNRLSPVAAFHLDGGWVIVAANPASGHFLFLAAIGSDPDEPLLRLSVVDLNGR